MKSIDTQKFQDACDYAAIIDKRRDELNIAIREAHKAGLQFNAYMTQTYYPIIHISTLLKVSK